MHIENSLYITLSTKGIFYFYEYWILYYLIVVYLSFFIEKKNVIKGETSFSYYSQYIFSFTYRTDIDVLHNQLDAVQQHCFSLYIIVHCCKSFFFMVVFHYWVFSIYAKKIQNGMSMFLMEYVTTLIMSESKFSQHLQILIKVSRTTIWQFYLNNQ